MTTLKKFKWVLTSEQRRMFIWILGLMFIGMVLEILGISLVTPVLSLMGPTDLATQYPWLSPWFKYLGNPNNEQIVIAILLLLVGVYAVKTVFLAFFSWQESKFVFGIQASLSQRLFSTYLHQPYTFHLQRNSALLIRNAITEVANFNTMLAQVMVLIAEGMVLLGISSLLLLVEPVGALLVIAVLGSTSFAFHYCTRARLFRWGKTRQYHEGLRIQHLQQGLGSAKEIKLFGRERGFLALYDVHNTRSAKASQSHATLKKLPRLWLELLVVVGIASLVFGLLAQGRDMTSILTTLGLFAAAAFRVMPSASRVLGAVQSLRYGLPVISIIYDELNLPVPAPSLQAAGNMPVFQEELRLAEVDYTYENAHDPALKNVSLLIRKGESVGIIGHSGAGKSTLVDVILGLLSPNGGKITVDEQDIQCILRSWQDQIGYVPQSIYLTDDTLRRNVAFGLMDEEIDDVAVKHAIRAAQLEEFVDSQHEGLECLVGERGVRLSGGQRQRVGIARALYHDPAVLVLDEATSSLDSSTEREVMKAVTAMHGDKTIIIVAHRFSTVEHCDRLYRLERGKVAQEGPPDAVLSYMYAVNK